LAATDRACSWLVAHQLVEHLHLQVVSLLPSFPESQMHLDDSRGEQTYTT
jgi:hypothetical protein